jgi:hypothetical protein
MTPDCTSPRLAARRAHSSRPADARHSPRPVRALAVALAFAMCAIAGLPALPWGLARGTVARAAEDDVVPEGIFRFNTTVMVETESRAFARDSVEHDLSVYALPDPMDRANVSGSLSREFVTTNLKLQYGLGDHWNLVIDLPYVVATQRSTLRVLDTSADPVLNATVAQLQSRTIEGMGNYRVTSLHRPLFTESNQLLWGVYFSGSTERNSLVYTGTGTFQTHDPYGSVGGFGHWGKYFPLFRGHLDLRTEYNLPLVDKVDTPTVGRVSLLGAPNVTTSLTWEHEPGAWHYGFGIIQHTAQQSRLAGEAQDDGVKEWYGHAELGYGNLDRLEHGPISFPTHVTLSWDETFFAFNAPVRDRLALNWLVYF